MVFPERLREGDTVGLAAPAFPVKEEERDGCVNKIIMGQSDLRDRFSAFGVTLVLAIGATLNLAVVMGMAPPKGVAMPFLSYGGSSLLASMMCIGLLLNFSRTAR